MGDVKDEKKNIEAEVKYASDRKLNDGDKNVKKVENEQSEIDQKLDLVKNIIKDAKAKSELKRRKRRKNLQLRKKNKQREKKTYLCLSSWTKFSPPNKFPDRSLNLEDSGKERGVSSDRSRRTRDRDSHSSRE